ncbi:ThiS family protein [Neomoorella glycerini]|uniref:ThiS family protein n=1 Tax=Neomoorella glycerini TaxID=55779 RepID=A0A6I5ZQN2_9FIRM|nr:MoaD/ThiS family protein [Moorella glycerini]QGP92282.1 ThiS family protein [Moorella glycerini]
MKVHVNFYGFLQAAAGTMKVILDLEAPANLVALWQQLAVRYPQLDGKDPAAILAVSLNGRRLGPEQWDDIYLRDGDQVDIFSIMSGG